MNKENHFLNISFSGTREQIENALYDKGVRDHFLSLFLMSSKTPNSLSMTEDGCNYEADLEKNSKMKYMNDMVKGIIRDYLKNTSIEEIVTDHQNALDSSDEPC